MPIQHPKPCIVCTHEPAIACVCFECAAELLRNRIAGQDAQVPSPGWTGWGDREPDLKEVGAD
jgi:hypothetical protein